MYEFLQSYPRVLEFLHTDFFNTSTSRDILINMLFAMVASFGFSYPSNPPKRVLFGIIFIAGLGYLIRSLLLQISFFNLAGASFCASFCMGIVAFLIAKQVKVPTEVIVFPALLALFPGSYGYKSILSLLIFAKNTDKPEQLQHLLAFFNNLIIMFSVSILLVAGALVTFMIFYEQSFLMTRGSKRT